MDRYRQWRKRRCLPLHPTDNHLVTPSLPHPVVGGRLYLSRVRIGGGNGEEREGKSKCSYVFYTLEREAAVNREAHYRVVHKKRNDDGRAPKGLKFFPTLTDQEFKQWKSGDI